MVGYLLGLDYRTSLVAKSTSFLACMSVCQKPQKTLVSVNCDLWKRTEAVQMLHNLAHVPCHFLLRDTAVTTMVMCVMLKFHPREELEDVGVLTKVVDPVSCLLGLWVHRVVWDTPGLAAPRSLQMSFTIQPWPQMKTSFHLTFESPEWIFLNSFKSLLFKRNVTKKLLFYLSETLTCPWQGCINPLGSHWEKVSCGPLLTSHISLTLSALCMYK